MDATLTLFSKWVRLGLIFGLALFVSWNQVQAQGVTTSALSGVISDQNGEPLIGATVLATHLPSGTSYGTTTLEDGRYFLPNMRIGGPYQIVVSYTGYEENSVNGLYLALGSTGNINLSLQEGVALDQVEVTAVRSDVFSSQRTGAGTNISTGAINSFPTLSRNLGDFVRLTPQSNGFSFGGQDNRLNNITVDGSIFNNSFGLAGQPGGRTGTSPISLDAIEEIQVNLAPYDVRQAGFVGAGINAVTRSGTNEFSGSVFYNVQNEGLVGDQADEVPVSITQFDNTQVGFRLGGPIIKNKLFFFVNGELERRTDPFLLQANSGSDPVAGNVTRVLASDLDRVSNALNGIGYETGPYSGYDLELQGNKFLAKLDWNISNEHKASIRYTNLNSERDVLISTSASLGFGARRGQDALSFQNSNYIQFEKIQSVIGELNSVLGGRISNKLIVGYTYQNEDRGSRGDFFPLIEIQNGARTYISAGFEPFTPFNQLSYHTYQLQDNLTIYSRKHTITAGFNFEHIRFRNVFFPGSQGVFVYNNIDDFLTDVDDYSKNPNRTVSPVNLRRFQYRYSALPGGAEPVQPTRVVYTGLYLQDEWAVSDKFHLTAGIRADVAIFGNTGFENRVVAEQTYRLNGEPVQVSTSKLPDPQILWSPRLGFNFDVLGNKSLQLRGGSGIFSGRPAFVWISNQIGNNGVLTGFEQLDATANAPLTSRPFTPTPGQFITNPSLPSSFELALTDPDFRFPQVWRSNLAVDGKLPLGLVGTVEFIYNQNINSVIYYNINQADPTQTFAGPDNRARFATADRRINSNTVNAIYLVSDDRGDAFTTTFQLEKPFTKGFFGRVAYTFGEARDIMSAGSIAAGSWTGAVGINGNNDLDLAFSNNDQRHRVLGALSYRLEYANFGATQIGLILESRNQGRFSYTVNGDLNGDAINNNELLFIPNAASELTFVPITTGSGANQVTLFTPQQQIDAFEAFINQDEYLSGRRGQYAERNGALLPWLTTVDLSFAQEFFVNVGGKRNTLQLRADIFNFTNMLNSKWGVGDRVIQARPITAAGVNAGGVPQYRMTTLGSGANQRLLTETFQKTADLSDLWRMQLGVRYIFN